MKIAVIGFSGGGKSTLARRLGDLYGVEVLHLDTVYHLSGWRSRPREESRAMVEAFLNTHDASGWVIDGNYGKLAYDRRMEEADRIVMLLLNRLDCLQRVCRRYRTYRGSSRPDMTEGCQEKLDAAFIRWILYEGRRGEQRALLQKVMCRYKNKLVCLRSQRDIDRYWKQCTVAEALSAKE